MMTMSTATMMIIMTTVVMLATSMSRAAERGGGLPGARQFFGACRFKILKFYNHDCRTSLSQLNVNE